MLVVSFSSYVDQVKRGPLMSIYVHNIPYTETHQSYFSTGNKTINYYTNFCDGILTLKN